jgi:two-component sensor histidine kinase
MERWEICNAELINYRKDGTPFWINTSLVPVADKEGGYSHWVVIGREITRQKRYEQALETSIKEKEVLLAEIHHRVKNNLAVVSSMMQLQAFQEQNEELQKKLVDSTFRIRTMATIHELLYQSNSYSRLIFNDIIKELVRNIDEVLSNGSRVNYHIKSMDVELNINQAIPCALIINEVVTNIYKHALSDEKTIDIFIELKVEGERVSLLVRDTGPGFPEEIDPQMMTSLGMNIIHVLCNQLNAESGYESSPDGVSFRLSFARKEVSGAGSARVR